jgi:chaperonin GroES
MAEKTKVRPNGNRVLVKPDAQEKTSGGIMLPDSVKDNCRRGHIVALGCGKVNERLSDRDGNVYFQFPPGIEEGATILYGRYAASDTKGVDDLKGNIIVNVDEIIAVIG